MSFERLLHEQHAALTRRLERLTGDPETAADLRQETLLRAWRAGPRAAAPEVQRAWLHRTATNLAIDELRRRRRRPLAPLEAAAAIGAADEDAAEAREALARLGAHERFVLLLRFEAGLSHREIGRLLDVGEEAARKRVARARARFAEALRAVRDDAPAPRVLLVVRDDAPEPYERWLAAAGARVRTARAGADEREVLAADALVVSGSHTDVHPALYRERPRPVLQGRPDLARDRRDLAALRVALDADLPVVGVCSGHQLLNLLSGGSLVQDLGEEGAAHAAEHPVRTADGSVARRLLGCAEGVPSEHHQGVRRVGARLRVGATSPDGVVESVERVDRRFALGVQWHPELSPAGGRVAEALVQAATERWAA